MRIVFFGTPDFSRQIAEGLHKKYEVVCVVSQPDRPRGRGHRLMPSPVKKWAMENKIPVLTPSSLRDPLFLEEIDSFQAEVFVVAAFGMLLPEFLLNMAPRGALNIHTSLLPKYRGASPVENAILAGESISGVTLMKMDKGLDTGDVYGRISFSIEGKNTAEIFEQMIPTSLTLLSDLFEAWKSGVEVPLTPQEGKASYCGKYDKSSFLLDWEESAEILARKIRAFYPNAYTYWGDVRLKILAASVKAPSDELPGVVSEANDEGIHVSTGDGVLSIEIIQRPGKRAMPVADFLRGASLLQGTKLGG
ncbi:MAG: methionyl-tRNA formyltransferase [Bacillota bacterium]|nr:methionyl-tRNA formyltransferase [Bacillota bacterium]